jgi:predicted acyl esterase
MQVRIPRAIKEQKGLNFIAAADLDVYREAIYTGGIPARRYMSSWQDRVKKASPKWKDLVNVEDLVTAHPFDNELWESQSVKPAKDGLPCFLAASQIFIIHGRGAYEAWRARRPENTHLQLVDCDYFSWPNHEAAGKILQFLNFHLKGVNSRNLEKVGIQMRLGNKQWYWRTETDWPVPGTQYTKWYLGRNGCLSTSQDEGPEERRAYSTKVPPSREKSGVSFQSLPFENDVEFAGHFTATLSISSSTSDADVVVTLWPIDEEGNVVPFSAHGGPEPLAKGFLRASHRKTDPFKSLPERPWHTHRLEDNAPLEPDEVVVIEVEIYPAAGRVRKGWKLRVDISPSEEQPDIPGYKPIEMRKWYGESHEKGVNAVHVGGERTNYITCPAVPHKQLYPNVL